MQNEATIQPEIRCQWCAGFIPENGDACTTCGAARPREDLVAPGYVEHPEAPSATHITAEPAPELSDEEIKARQILKDLDAYIPEELPAARTAPRDTSDDVLVVVGVLVVSGIVGGLMGWFLAPPLIHNLFNDVIGVDTDGPEAFRRLGGFTGAMITMLFGALLVTVMRR